jgi:hypothetical protein
MSLPTSISNLVAFWDFQEPEGSPRISCSPVSYRLEEMGGAIPREKDGIFGPYSARFGDGPWMRVPRQELGALNIHGPEAQVTVVAWIKRHPAKPEWNGCQAVAGIWNEHARRQYCLFLNLHIHEQVGAHMSAIGGATPGFKYCMDAAIGATPVPLGIWQCAAVSYDGLHMRAWLNGRLDERGERNPYAYPGGLFDGGPDGADFTVGAVQRPESIDENFHDHGSIIGNPYYGLLGGLAVYNRALTAEELAALSAPGGCC